MTTISIPNSVTHIGDDAFEFCEGLSAIAIPNSVTTIGGGAFVGCKKLTIKCTSGSCAETYAKSFDIPFVAE